MEPALNQGDFHRAGARASTGATLGTNTCGLGTLLLVMTTTFHTHFVTHLLKARDDEAQTPAVGAQTHEGRDVGNQSQGEAPLDQTLAVHTLVVMGANLQPLQNAVGLHPSMPVPESVSLAASSFSHTFAWQSTCMAEHIPRQHNQGAVLLHHRVSGSLGCKCSHLHQKSLDAPSLECKSNHSEIKSWQ